MPRNGDVLIVTPYKSGTTWMQTIVMHLIFQDLRTRPLPDFSPWLDLRLTPVEETIHQLEQHEHRRFIKTHLPLDGIPYFSQCKYIVVGRDARDVFMSLWNHHKNLTKEFLREMNSAPGLVGHPCPRCPEEIRDFWHQWITVGWFDWETEGYPYWSNLRHMQSWWNFRHLPNILFVHFNDLLSHLEGELLRIADFLDITVTADLLPRIADAVTFKNIKQNADALLPHAAHNWTGGGKTFINMGINGRWRDVLTDADLALYEAAVLHELTHDCRLWLENGRLQVPQSEALQSVNTG